MPAVTAATPWFSRTIVSTLVMPVGVAEALGVADAGAELGRPASAGGLHAARAVTRAARDRARRQGVRRRSRSTATTDRRTGGNRTSRGTGTHQFFVGQTCQAQMPGCRWHSHDWWLV